MSIRIPTLFNITPMTAYITATNTRKVSRFTSMRTLPLDRVKFLHQGHHESITHVGATVTLGCGYVFQVD